MRAAITCLLLALAGGCATYPTEPVTVRVVRADGTDAARPVRARAAHVPNGVVWVRLMDADGAVAHMSLSPAKPEE